MAGSDSDSPGSMANKICHLVVEMHLAHELKMANEMQARQAAEAQAATRLAELNAAEETKRAVQQQLDREVGHLTGQLAEQVIYHNQEMAKEVQARQAAEAQAATRRAELNKVEEDKGALLQQLNELQTLFVEHGHNIPLYNMPAGYQDPRGRSLGGGYTQDASGVVRLRREQC